MSSKQREQQAFKGPHTSPSASSFPAALAPGTRSCLPCAAHHRPWAGTVHPRGPSPCAPTNLRAFGRLALLPGVHLLLSASRRPADFSKLLLPGRSPRCSLPSPSPVQPSGSLNAYRPPTTLTASRGVIKKSGDGEYHGQGPPNGKAGVFGKWRVDPQ